MKNVKVLILGAGSGGISLASRLLRDLSPSDLAIVDPSEVHHYQPLWTLAGAGLLPKEDTQKSQKELIPDGVEWIRDAVLRVDPKNKRVHLASGLELSFEYLVVATGLRLAWEKIRGLEGHLGKNGICSVYQYDQIDETARQIQALQSGTALFVMPPVPIKCAGAPQKIMYVAEHLFRQRGVRDKIQVRFATAGKAMFGIPVFAETLAKIVKERNITPHFQHKIVGVDAAAKQAIFSVTDAEGKVSEQRISYDVLHLVPPMEAHSYVAESGLAFEEGDQKGWLKVDKETLQHLEYPNIFGIGDVTGVPNSKTGAAVRAQYPVVADNLLAVMSAKSPIAKYNGYSSCPLITEIGRVMLAEFGYDGKLLPTFPVLNPATPYRSMWYLKRYLLPVLYWKAMLKGRA